MGMLRGTVMAMVCCWGMGAAQERQGADPAPPGQAAAGVEERLREQERRIRELEERLRVAPPPPPAPAGEERKAVDFVRWNEVSALGSRFRLYGFLRLDAIYDDSRPSNTQVIAFVRSEDPDAINAFRADPNAFGGVNPERFASRENQDSLTLHPRLTRLGLDFDGPTVAALGQAKVTGKMEIDFYNNGLLGQSESRAAIRMRHAYLRLAWKRFNVLAGQTADVISPIFPIVNPDLVMWGAGNLGDRRPQVRPEYVLEVGMGKLFLQGGIGLTGADDNQDLDAPNTFGQGFRDGEASGLPTLQARVAYQRPLWEKTTLELGAWAHRAWEETDQRFNNHTHFDSYAYGADLTLPLLRDLLALKGEIWWGANVDDVRGGIFQGINTTTGREIVSRGGWVELGWRPLRWYLLSVGYSTDDPGNGDVGLGGRASNKIAYLSNRFYSDPVEFGLDYLYWKTEFVGFDDGDDNRIQAYASYKF